jgi:hypothetical protein
MRDGDESHQQVKLDELYLDLSSVCVLFYIILILGAS